MKQSRKKVVKKEENKQLDLGIKEPFKNKLFKLKGKADTTFLQLEVRKFLKDPFFWFTVVFDLIITLQQGWLIYKFFNKLPTLIPVFRYYYVELDSLTNKLSILIFPILSLVISITGIIVSAINYNREKKLATFILLSTILATVACDVILIQLISTY